METSENDKITPEKAVEILKKGGLEVTLEQAKLMLEFLYKLADITADQYLEKTKLDWLSTYRMLKILAILQYQEMLAQ